MSIDQEKLEALISEYRTVNARRHILQRELKNICEQQTGIEKQINVVLGFVGFRLPYEGF